MNEKPEEVKILQISAVNGMDGYIVYGLGDDGKIYWWCKFKKGGVWILEATKE